MNTKLRKALIYTIVASLLVVGGGYAAYRAYRSARQARLVEQARNYLTHSKPRKAYLCLQRALRYNNRDVKACRLMAELTEAGGSSAALNWRSRVVELKPHSLDDRLALAQTAVKFRNLTVATNALAGASKMDRQSAAYQNVAGIVAAAANQPVQAEAHFLKAIQLDPKNAVPQLSLAAVRLAGTNTTAIAEARSTLKMLSANPTNATLRRLALRDLAMDALRHRQMKIALTYSAQLLQQTNKVFNDHILRLDVLQAARSPDFKPALADVQHEASTNAGSIFELGTWQMARLGPSETLAWLQSLPPDARTNAPVPLFVAECQVQLKDWKGLQTYLEKQNWTEQEFLRDAFLTRALRGQDLDGAAKAEWELALKVANNQNQLYNLVQLFQLAGQWKWQSEAENILWNIVNLYPNQKWAVQVLSRTLVAEGRTRPLLMLFSQELKRFPSDLSIKNNVAMSALLLKANELKPFDMAREVYEKAPTNAAYASTYAFALHLQGKDKEALKVMQTLSPKQLSDPSIAGYYGLILKATGDHEKAKPYLNWAFKGKLLPEERKLFEQAGAGA